MRNLSVQNLWYFCSEPMVWSLVVVLLALDVGAARLSSYRGDEHCRKHKEPRAFHIYGMNSSFYPERSAVNYSKKVRVTPSEDLDLYGNHRSVLIELCVSHQNYQPIAKRTYSCSKITEEYVDLSYLWEIRHFSDGVKRYNSLPSYLAANATVGMILTQALLVRVFKMPGELKELFTKKAFFTRFSELLSIMTRRYCFDNETIQRDFDLELAMALLEFVLIARSLTPDQMDHNPPQKYIEAAQRYREKIEESELYRKKKRSKNDGLPSGGKEKAIHSESDEGSIVYDDDDEDDDSDDDELQVVDKDEGQSNENDLGYDDEGLE